MAIYFKNFAFGGLKKVPSLHLIFKNFAFGVLKKVPKSNLTPKNFFLGVVEKSTFAYRTMMLKFGL